MTPTKLWALEQGEMFDNGCGDSFMGVFTTQELARHAAQENAKSPLVWEDGGYAKDKKGDATYNVWEISVNEVERSW